MACQTGSYCTGSSYKYDSGCTNSCSTWCGTCGSNCGDGCSGCGGACQNTCQYSCSGSCSGDCSGCGGSCSYNCSGSCTGDCTNTCSGSCTGQCSTYCDNGCSGQVFTTAYNNLLNNLSSYIKTDEITELRDWIASEGARSNTAISTVSGISTNAQILRDTFYTIATNLNLIGNTNSSIGPLDNSIIEPLQVNNVIQQETVKAYINKAKQLYSRILKSG